MKSTRLSSEQLVQHLTPPPGITMPRYPARRDRVYRGALVSFAAFLAVTGIGTELASPVVIVLAHWGAALSAVVAGWTFLVWLSSWRWVVRGLVVIGLGLSMWPVLSVPSWGFILLASAIMAAKETHCFHFKAGKIIPWYTLGLGCLVLAGLMPSVLGVFWLGLSALWGWLLVGRLKLPLFIID